MQYVQNMARDVVVWKRSITMSEIPSKVPGECTFGFPVKGCCMTCEW